MKKILFLAILALSLSSPAYAVNIFHEDFNTGPLGTLVDGVPTIAKGADNDWYGARFDSGDDTIVSEIFMNATTDSDGRFARFEDNAGILYQLSTKNYTDVVIDFSWSTVDLESGDTFRAGYYVGDISGFNANRIVNLTTTAPGWTSWTEAFTGSSTPTWTSASFNLPANTENVWFAFWLDNGDGDRGRVDTINVTANAIPEPASLSLLGIGILGLFGLRRKK